MNQSLCSSLKCIDSRLYQTLLPSFSPGHDSIFSGSQVKEGAAAAAGAGVDVQEALFEGEDDDLDDLDEDEEEE